MKSLLFVVTSSLMVLAARISYDAGRRDLQQFETTCGEPGVRCTMAFAPQYLQKQHSPIRVPENVTGAFFDDDGSLRGLIGECIQGENAEIAGAIFECFSNGDGWGQAQKDGRQ